MYRPAHLAMAVAVLACLGAPLRGADYAVMEKALTFSSKEVNKYDMPQLLYGLDRQTAEKYFRRYFTRHCFTMPLRVNLGYPTFHWGNNHKALQRALTTVFLEHLRGFFHRHPYPAKMNNAVARNNLLHEHSFNILAFFVTLMESNALTHDDKKGIGKELHNILASSRLCSRRFWKTDINRQPFVNSIRAQFIMTCFSYSLVSNDFGPLSKILPLSGLRKLIWDKEQVLILDNERFNRKQLLAIANFLASIPEHCKSPLVITCYDYLIGPNNNLVTVHSFACLRSFNIFGVYVGAEPGNHLGDLLWRDQPAGWRTRFGKTNDLILGWEEVQRLGLNNAR